MDLVSKPRSKSTVWLYFGLKADEKGRPLNSEEAICRLCRKIVLAKGGNTTNLRSHLKRRHRADFFETLSSSSSGALFDSQGLDLNNEEPFEDFPSLQTASHQNYVADAVLPPGEPWHNGGPSRAVLSLPSCLQMREMKVYAKCQLQQGVMFGPFVGEACKEQMPTNLKYVWAIRDDTAFIYVDASHENKSNWMRFVTYTSNEEEHNLVVFQFYRRIYYRVSRPITEGAELKVWIGKDYATLLGLGMGDNEKCQVGEKETVFRLLQDIQLITLRDPNCSSLWPDHSQSQSPKPVISDVTSISSQDAAPDSGVIPGCAIPSCSSSFFSFPSPGSFSSEKYDFMPGTEKLLSNPNTYPHSPWYFFGFEPDSNGRPLDRSSTVCKLCGEHVGCGGGTVDLQNHLSNKHHIKLREGNRERPLGHQRTHAVMANSYLVSAVPHILTPHVTNAITNFIIMDLQPPALVEGEGFRKLIHTLLPTYKELPSPNQLEILLKEHHNKGKADLAGMLRRNVEGEENKEIFDHTAPVELESIRRPPSYWHEVPHFVILSVDIWFHNWQGNTEQYLTLWAHYIDLNFNFHNVALETQRLKEYSLRAVEAQVKVMAQEWRISQPNVVLLGGEGQNKISLEPLTTKKVKETTGSIHHPNSTTFLERDDTVSREEPPDLEDSFSGEGLPSVPCFFSTVQGCIEEVMSHPVISDTLSQFQCILSSVFLSPAETKFSYQQSLTKQEQAELKNWAHSRPSWNRLYSLLSILIKHKSLFCDMVKDIKSEALSTEDASSESSFSGGYYANSTSSVHSMSSTSASNLRSGWKVLEDLCLVLKPLDVACRTLAKEAFPRLSLIKPILTGLLSRHLVSRPGDSSSSILKEVKRMMRRNLASHYDIPAVNRVVCVVCSLDPQFHGLGFMEEEERRAAFDWLKNEAVRIVKEDRRRSQSKNHCKRSPSSGSSESESDLLRRSKRLKESRPANFRDFEFDDEESDVAEDDDSDFADPGPQGALSGMEFLLGDLFSSVPRSKQSSVEESVDMEMSVFRADRGTSLGVEPLQWWRTKAVQFPLLATVARAYLAAPAVAGNAVQEFLQEAASSTYKRRSNIPPESLDSILFLHHNMCPPQKVGKQEPGMILRGAEKVP